MQLRNLLQLRTIIVGGVVAGLVVPLSACGGSAKASAAEATMQKEATLYQIDQIEKKFHKAGSTHDVNLMMSLWAPGATFNIGTSTYTGKAEIRHFFAKVNPAFQPQNHWESDTPSYKIKITVNGDTATMYMECHYIDERTGKAMSIVGVDHNLQKIHGKWLIVNGSASTATLG